MLPRHVESEKNPEILKAYLRNTLEYVSRLENVNKSLELEKAKKDQQSLNLSDDLLLFKKMLFGKSSEKTKTNETATEKNTRKRSEQDLEVHARSLAPEPKDFEINNDLEEVVLHHELTNEELSAIAIEYGYDKESEWECLTGFYDESSEVDIKVESYIRKKHKRFKYRLKETKGSDCEVIVTAKNALKLIPGGKYSIDFGLDVVTKKYLYHLPLERQRRQLESAGLEVGCRSLYSQCFFISCYLEEVTRKIKEEIKNSGLCLHLDETPWPINNNKQSDGYMWVMSNQAGSYYQFESTRSGRVAKELVGNYKGPVLTDGYGGYKNIFRKNENIVLSFCWSHVRRKFKDIEKNYPKETKEILEYINNLFLVERRAKDFEDLKILRKTESKPIIDKIKTWFYETKKRVRKQSGLEKAINYSLNHWLGLVQFLKDEKIPLSNNEAERTIRTAVMGRKNFYGSKTINGADTASTIYTVIESCKKVELDPKKYLKMAVEKAIKKEDVPTPLQYAKEIRKSEVKTV